MKKIFFRVDMETLLSPIAGWDFWVPSARLCRWRLLGVPRGRGPGNTEKLNVHFSAPTEEVWSHGTHGTLPLIMVSEIYISLLTSRTKFHFSSGKVLRTWTKLIRKIVGSLIISVCSFPPYEPLTPMSKIVNNCFCFHLDNYSLFIYVNFLRIY